MGWLSNILGGGAGELGWDDLVRRIVDALVPLRRHGARGEVVFPPEVTVRIVVGQGGLAIVQGFVDRPELDREVGAALANRCDVASDQLPVREYLVSAADRTSVTVSEGAPKAWQVTVEGGDLAGRTMILPGGWSEAAFGRGEWHGADRGARNDVIACDKTEFVSRRAGRLYRAGHQLEVAALDQGDELVVRRASGEAVRPARTARGRVVIKPGDTIELIGPGGRDCVRLVITRVAAD